MRSASALLSDLNKVLEEKERVVVRFAGDSGDGIQLAGNRFAAATALIGNDLVDAARLPGRDPGPGGDAWRASRRFQIHFASRDILTPGGRPNALVAMNPAALKMNLPELESGGILIVNEDGFTKTTLRKAQYESSPLEDGTLDDYQVFRVPMTSMTVRATDGIDGITARDAARSKNLFALGLVSWMYSRPVDATARWIEEKFASMPAVMNANLAAFRAGYNFGETAELLQVHYEVKPAPAQPGTYRSVNGTGAAALGLIAASVRSGLPLFLASYPITPASELLHELSRHKRFGVRTVQAEDEIAASNMALGAAFGGHLGVTVDQRPRHGPEGRDDRPRRGPGAATAGDRRPAGRALDRDADQDRGRRPADGDPRPPRRVATAGARRRDPGAVLRRGPRVGPDRGPLPHAGDPALGHLPRQLVRAVAAARRGGPAARSTPASPPSPNRDGRVLALPARRQRWRGPGRCRGRRASSTWSAGSRRRTSTGHISYEPDNHAR